MIYTEAYQDFLARGRELKVQVRKGDVVRDKGFERRPDIAARLRTGFELPPVPPAKDEREAEDAIAYAPDWARAAVTVYRFGGRIRYREVSPTEYEAILELPPLFPVG